MDIENVDIVTRIFISLNLVANIVFLDVGQYVPPCSGEGIG